MGLALLIACALHAPGPPKGPFQPIAVTADKLPGLLRGAGGAYVRMPRAEFDALARAAAQAERSRKSPPRLIEARYTAELTEAPALSGNVTWKVRHGGGGPALLRLASSPAGFNLALRSPRFENRDALLAEFPVPGGQPTPALLVDEPGEHTVNVDWSARVEARPDGLHTELRLPPCPASVVELTLPDDCTLSGPDGVTVRGPLDLGPGKPRHKRWDVAVGGRVELPLVVRRGGGRAPVITVRQKTVHKLSPRGLVASHRIEVVSLHGDVQELELRHDPSLRPEGVEGVERWKALPGREPVVRVWLRRPVREASLVLTALAPLCPAGQRGKACNWTSPWVSVKGAVPRGERLELLLAPGLGVSSWSPGDFVLAASPRPGKGGARQLSFLGGGLGVPGKPGQPPSVRRPTLTLQAGAVSFHARQLAYWRIGPEGMELTARLDYKMRQGQLFQLAAALPAGWEAESARGAPEGLVSGWGVRGNVLLARLARPLGGECSLTVRLRPSRPGRLAGATLALPLLEPLEARHHEGGLAVDYDGQAYRATPTVEPDQGGAPAEGPWGARLPELYFPFVGAPPAAALRLTMRPARIRADAEVNVSIDGGRALQQTRLVLEAQGGRPDKVDLFVAGPAGPAWLWQAEPAPRSVDRLHGREVAAALAGLGGGGPLGAAAFAGRPRGTFWRITFARPLVPRRPITLRASRQLEPLANGGRQRWEAALPVVLGAARMTGEVAVRLGGGEQASAEPGQLVEQPQQRRPGAWRSYRYSGAGARLVLEAWGGPSGTSEARIDGARLVSVLTAEGGLRHKYSFRVWRWAGRRLPVKLPPGARFVAASANGRWLENVPVEDEEALVPVPVSSGAASVELHYETEGGRGPWARLESPAPRLPVAPVGVRRLWVLPPGVRPLLDGAARPLPGGPGPASPRLRAPADLLRLGPPLPLPGRPSGQPSHRERDVAEAWAAVRNVHPGKKLSRRELVGELAFDHLGPRCPLVVDALALERDGNKRPAPPDELEAVLLATHSGALLTSRAQAELWEGEVPSPVEGAARQAAASGRDPSGRFASALEWLYHEGAPPEQLEALEYLREGWTAWQPLAGSGPPDGLRVVHAWAPAGAGAGLAVLLLAGLVLLRNASGGARLRWLIGGLALSGLALAWLPTSLLDLARWPFIAGLLLLLPVLFTFQASEARRAPSTAGPGKGAAVAVSLLLALALGGAAAQAPTAEVVYLVEGPSPTVLLRPALKKRLRELARPDGLPGDGAVLASAAYAGRMSGDVAEFTATFKFHTFDEGRARVFIPLGGVQLVGDVFLNDKRVLPVARGGANPGYLIPGGEKGGRTVTLRFRVAVTGVEGEPGMRQVRFQAPRLWQTRLTFTAPAGAAYLHAPRRGGGQSVKADANGPVLDADLGALSGPLALRWHQAGMGGGKQTYREAYVWDLAADAARLTAYVRYTLTGSALALRLDVPGELAVLAARARRPGGKDTVRLAGWEASGGRLKLDFPAPVSGEVELEVELAPRAPLAGKALLPLPRPHGEAADKSHLAYRAPGLAVSLTGEGLTGEAPARFAADWPAPSRPPVEGLSYASTFRRKAPPRVSVTVRPQAGRPQAEQHIRWTVGPGLARYSARLTLSGPGAPPALQYDLSGRPGVLVSSVKGPPVDRWAQSGGNLLVWLKGGPAPAGPIEISGWVPLPKSGEPVRFSLPGLRPVGAAARTELELLPEPGWKLLPQRPRLRELPAAASRGRVYETRERSYGGTFLLRRGAAPTSRVVTKAFVKEGAVRFESRVVCLVPREAPWVTVRLRNWPGEADLEAPAGTLLRLVDRLRRGSGRRERSWRLEPRPDVERLELVVRGRVPLDEAAGGVPMPEVQAGTGKQVVSVGPGLVAAEAALVPEAPTAAAPAEVLLQEVRASAPDGQRWLHEVTWWLRQGRPAELRLSLPDQVAVVALEVDGAPWPAGKTREAIALPLPPTARPRQVRLVYRRDPGREPLSRPELAPPKLDGATPGPVVWSAEVPQGWELSGPSTPWLPPAVGRAVQALYRARANGGGLKEAELALKAAGPGDWPLGPGEQNLGRWLEELRRGRGAGAKGGPAPEGGSARWFTKDATSPPVLRLASVAARRPEQGVIASLQWLGLGLALWAVSLSSWLRAAGRWLWPELLLALGLVGWYFNGPVLAPVLLVVVGAVARGVLLYLGVTWLLRPAPAG